MQGQAGDAVWWFAGLVAFLIGDFVIIPPFAAVAYKSVAPNSPEATLLTIIAFPGSLTITYILVTIASRLRR